jgi:hypothetical protein
MVGKLVKIAIALLIVNGVVRLGTAYLADYRFEDRLTQIAQFGDRRTEAQLCSEAAEAARVLELPVPEEAIHIKRGGNPAFTCGKGYQGAVARVRSGAQKLYIDAAYERDVDILPGYTRRFSFNPSVEVWARVW